MLNPEAVVFINPYKKIFPMFFLTSSISKNILYFIFYIYTLFRYLMQRIFLRYLSVLKTWYKTFNYIIIVLLLDVTGCKVCRREKKEATALPKMSSESNAPELCWLGCQSMQGESCKSHAFLWVREVAFVILLPYFSNYKSRHNKQLL